jgi:hypothetical protein
MARYSMSFTTAALLHRESIIVAELYAELKDWTLVKNRVLEENLMQVKRARSSLNFYREVQSRLVLLTEDQFEYLLNASRDGQLHMLWVAVCKRFPFIGEFASEVIREKYLRLDFHVGREDYDVFFNAKAAWDERLERLTEKTKGKQRPMVFAMLREAELLTPDGFIISPSLDDRFLTLIKEDSPALLAIFPVSDQVIS